MIWGRAGPGGQYHFRAFALDGMQDSAESEKCLTDFTSKKVHLPIVFWAAPFWEIERWFFLVLLPRKNSADGLVGWLAGWLVGWWMAEG